MDLVKTIEEQFTFGFTGRINILTKENNQFLGAILQKEGNIIHCTYNRDVGKKALLSIVLDSQKMQDKFRFIVEPEIIDDNVATFNLNHDDFYREMKQFLEEVESTRNLRPPGHLRLLVNADFVIQGDPIEPIEFDILKCITDHSKVDEIYQESEHYEYMITRALVSLRKKSAIKVIR